MIEGLKLTVTGAEVKQLCYDRADHCQAQADKARTQAESVKRDAVGETGYTNGDPVRALSDLAERYDSEAKTIRFYGDHINEAETYLLDGSDLRTLGILHSRY